MIESVCRYCLCTTVFVFRDNVVVYELVAVVVRCVVCSWVGIVVEYREGYVMEYEGM